MSRRDAAWLAGVFEGDGCLSSDKRSDRWPCLKLECVDRPLVEEAARLMCANVTYHDDSRGGRQRLWIARRTGRATFPMVEQMLPHFGERRRAQAARIWGITTDIVESGSHEWAAGLMEAEGCFKLHRDRPSARLKMTDRDVVERACAVWEINLDRIGTRRGYRAGWLDSYSIDLYSTDAHYVARSVFPFLRGERKRADIAVWLGGQLVT